MRNDYDYCRARLTLAYLDLRDATLANDSTWLDRARRELVKATALFEAAKAREGVRTGDEHMGVSQAREARHAAFLAWKEAYAANDPVALKAAGKAYFSALEAQYNIPRSARLNRAA